MEFVKSIVDFVLHLDIHLSELIQTYGIWTYGILFIVIFCETGLVVTPFLPGDSLLFAAGNIRRPRRPQGRHRSSLFWPRPRSSAIRSIIGSEKSSARKSFTRKKRASSRRNISTGRTISTRNTAPRRSSSPASSRSSGRLPHLSPGSAGCPTASSSATMSSAASAGSRSFTFGGYFFGNIPFVKKNFTSGHHRHHPHFARPGCGRVPET